MNLTSMMAKHAGKKSTSKPKAKAKSTSQKKPAASGGVDLDSLMARHSLSRQQKRGTGGKKTSTSKKASAQKKTSVSKSVWTGKGAPPQGRVKHGGAWGKWITFGKGTDAERTVFRRESAPKPKSETPQARFYRRVIGRLKDDHGFSHKEAFAQASALWRAKQKAEEEEKGLAQAEKSSYIDRMTKKLKKTLGMSESEAKAQAAILWEAKSKSRSSVKRSGRGKPQGKAQVKTQVVTQGQDSHSWIPSAPGFKSDAQVARQKRASGARKQRPAQVSLDQIIARYAG